MIERTLRYFTYPSLVALVAVAVADVMAGALTCSVCVDV